MNSHNASISESHIVFLLWGIVRSRSVNLWRLRFLLKLGQQFLGDVPALVVPVREVFVSLVPLQEVPRFLQISERAFSQEFSKIIRLSTPPGRI